MRVPEHYAADVLFFFDGHPEELALYEGWVTEEQVHATGDELSMTLYGKYLQCL